jgi:hypothetical protein
MSAKLARDTYWTLFKQWQVYCDANPLSGRTSYTADEMIDLCRMDFYFHLAYLSTNREGGSRDAYRSQEHHNEMVRARKDLAHWLGVKRRAHSPA